MKHRLVAVIAAASLAVCAASEPPVGQTSPKGDRDIGSDVYVGAGDTAGPLADAVNEATTNPIQPQPKAPRAPSAISSVAETPKPPNAAVAPAPVVLPPAPASVLAHVTQGREPEFTFSDTPITEAARVIGRYLDRPVQLSLNQDYRVTGTWRNTPPLTVLQALAERYGFTLRADNHAFTLEQGAARQLELAAATPITNERAPSYQPLPDTLFADTTVRPVAPVTGKNRAALDAKLSKEEAAARKRRAELQAQLR